VAALILNQNPFFEIASITIGGFSKRLNLFSARQFVNTSGIIVLSQRQPRWKDLRGDRPQQDAPDLSGGSK